MLGPILEFLSIVLAAKLVISEGNSDVPLPVHGIINQSADLPIPVNQTGSEQDIYWTFQGFILAHVINNQLKIINKEFGKRLEKLENGRILRINNLRKEDGGLYTVTIQFTDQNTYNTSYNLTVYEPVPPPVIWIKWTGNTTERCNVTLHCSVPLNTSDFSYTWKYRHQNSGEYQLYNNGGTIQISLKKDSRELEVLCIVHNLADQKNVSYNVQNICSHIDTFRQSKEGIRRHYYIWFIAALVVLSMIFGWFLLKKIKRRKSEEKREKDSREMSEIHYADLTLGTHSCSDQRAEPKDEDIGAVVYSAVMH